MSISLSKKILKNLLRNYLPKRVFFLFREIYNFSFQSKRIDKWKIKEEVNFFNLKEELHFQNSVENAINGGLTPIVYIPWLENQTPRIVSCLESCLGDKYIFIPFLLTPNPSKEQIQKLKNKVKKNPTIFFNDCRDFFKRQKNGEIILLFSQDWYFVQRLVLLASKVVGIKTILAPHEGVWFFKDKYYRDHMGLTYRPGCDLNLCWNIKQFNIFKKRGVPENRLMTVGSVFHSTKEKYDPIPDFNKLSLQFICQPMDMQVDKNIALNCQRETVKALADFAKIKKIDMSVRLPSHDVFSNDDLDYFKKQNVKLITYSEPRQNWVGKSNIIISHNSTGLLEAAISGCLPISVTSFPFETLLEDFPELCVKDTKKLVSIIDDILESFETGGWLEVQKNYKLDAVSKMSQEYFGSFTPSHFDNAINALNTGAIGFWEDGGSDFAVFSSNMNNNYFSNLEKLVQLPIKNWNSLSDFQKFLTNKYMIWGSNTDKKECLMGRLAQKKGVNYICLEDHPFLGRKKNNEPCSAIIMTPSYPYYDQRNQLFQAHPLTPNELNKISLLREKLLDNRITKYMDGVKTPLTENIEMDAVLYLDQRFGDHSLKFGGVNDKSIEDMKDFLISCQQQVYVKIHPDVLSGYKSIYTEKLQDYINYAKVLGPEIDIIDCLEKFSKFAVFTSGSGYEAQLRKKQVKIFGNPFYRNVGNFDKEGVSIDNSIFCLFYKHARFVLNGKTVSADKYYDSL